MPPRQHVSNGLARPADESMLARDWTIIGTTDMVKRLYLLRIWIHKRTNPPFAHLFSSIQAKDPGFSLKQDTPTVLDWWYYDVSLDRIFARRHDSSIIHIYSTETYPSIHPFISRLSSCPRVGGSWWSSTCAASPVVSVFCHFLQFLPRDAMHKRDLWLPRSGKNFYTLDEYFGISNCIFNF